MFYTRIYHYEISFKNTPDTITSDKGNIYKVVLPLFIKKGHLINRQPYKLRNLYYFLYTLIGR